MGYIIEFCMMIAFAFVIIAFIAFLIFCILLDFALIVILSPIFIVFFLVFKVFKKE